MGCCGESDSGLCYSHRSFLTKEEKLVMLQEYKEALEKEAKGVGEKIAEMSK